MHCWPGREFSSSWELIEVCEMGARVCCVFVLLQERCSNFIHWPLVTRCLFKKKKKKGGWLGGWGILQGLGGGMLVLLRAREAGRAWRQAGSS